MRLAMSERRTFPPTMISLALAVLALVACDDRGSRDRGAQGSAIPGADLPATPSGLDPLVEEFRATERTVLQRYNEALRSQRENSIDELELSNTIERDVLTPWRALRAKVAAAPPQDELYSTLRRYLETRQVS